MCKGLGHINSSVKKASDNILNNFLKNYRSILEKEVNSISHAILISRSPEHNMFNMEKLPIYALFDEKFENGRVHLHCKVYYDENDKDKFDRVLIDKKEADISDLEEYDGNRYINLFLHTISDLDISVFLP